MEKLRKYIQIAFCILPVSVLFTGFVPVQAKDRNEAFDELIEQDFIDTMESDYLSMHFTVKDYEAMGITKPEPVLGEINQQSFIDMRDQARDMIDKLESFDKDTLSAEQQTDYDAIMAAYIDQRDRAADANFNWLFTPSSNIILNTSTNLTEFVFYTEEDFQDYISLLSSFPAYLDSAMTLTEQQAEDGYFMADAALEETLASIDAFVAKTEDNPIIVDFENDADLASYLSDGAKVDYKTQITDIVLNTVLPACEDVYNRLSALKGSGSNTGYTGIEGGAEYFEKVLQNNSSTDRSAEEQFEDLDAFLVQTIHRYIEQIQHSGSYGSVNMRDADEVLSYLSSHFEEYDFPSIEDVSYDAQYLDPSVVSGNVLAYYVGSPVDAYQDNAIKINGDGVTDANTLYQTLAHEGYPGHLYQHVYYLGTDPLLLRTVCSFLGYSEGWAMYAELEALGFDVLSEDDASLMANELTLNYALSAITDIAVNYLGYDEAALSEYLESIGLNSLVAADFYDMAICYPGDYGSYGYGMMRFLNMREYAEGSLGSDFDALAFHKVILDGGPRLLDDVEEDVENWVEEQGGVSIKKHEESKGTPYLIVAGVAAVGLIGVVVLRYKHTKQNPFA